MSDVRDERLGLAEEYLHEAVYRSRGAQAGAGLFARGDPGAADCGLGVKAEVVLDLSPRGEELFRQLWPGSLDGPALERVRAVTAEWIRRQDALDRKRNHFLKAFRQEHGFDRATYGPEEQAAYRAGLDGVNAEADEARREAARELLAG